MVEEPATVMKKASTVAPKELLYKDLRLQHLNPGYDNREAYEFLKNYQSRETLVLDTFKYNDESNEENFIIEIAGRIRTAWLQDGKPALAVFRQFNRQRTGKLSMYGEKITK